MNNKFYRLPIDFSSFILSRDLKVPTCSEMESIDQNIELLLSTCPGEHEFNKEWGCRIWEMDFVNVTSRKQWEDQFKKHISDAIMNFEPRLSSSKITIDISEISQEDEMLDSISIKKKVSIQVETYLVSNGDKVEFRYVLFLGPLSTE